VFIKRQENHLRRTWRNPTGVPTFRVEWENLKKLTHYGIPVPLPLYYGEREFEGRPQAILITYELPGFSALDEWLQEHPADRSRRALLPPLADTIRRLHDHRFRHNCLYPKHILIRAENEGGPSSTPEVRLIDLEKSRRVFSPMGARIRDLDTLLRRCPQWSEHEKNLFLSYYLNAGLEKLDPADLAARLGQYPLVEWIKKRIAVKQS
ncbi:MAG: hypothetical protein JXR89_07530, partial [Deltaproteobacteria bacterium]|nr:hypothetical protein [Deltaproteobacteria bacterium]